MGDRFWSRVDRSGGGEECWPWLGAKNADGYGTIFVDGHRRGTHCVAYELAHGVSLLGTGKHVLHGCDHPPCCNPAHLSLGTNLDNIRDRAAKGRSKDQRGSKHALTRLTEADVVAMRAAFWQGEKLTTLAARYGISIGTASPLLNGRTWSHVPMPSGERRRLARTLPSDAPASRRSA